MSSLKVFMSCEYVTRPGYEVCVVPAETADIDSLFSWAPGTVDEVRIDRVAERLVTDAQSAAAFWQALYRACAHGALVILEVAPPAEITDKPPAFPYLLDSMRSIVERNWSLDIDASAGFAVEQGISFGLVTFTPVFTYDYHRQIKRRKISQAKALQHAGLKTGVLLSTVFTLIANKRLHPFQEIEI